MATSLTSKAAREDLRERRRRAGELYEEGYSQAEVARRVKVSRTTSMRWYRAWEKSGSEGLRLAPRRGRPPKLTSAQLREVESALLRGPQAAGWSTDLWTLPRVAELIQDLTGVRYHPGHVWRVLRGMGWSLQRPTTRARERDEEAILVWKKDEWSRVKKTPVPEGRSSSSTRAGSPKRR